jgi:predicted phosphoribosyltransferase
MTPKRFSDRREAGRLLAAKLAAYANRPDVVVLALPRGGVPVAFEVAQALNAPLDVFVVRKLGVPGYEELAMGAVATGGLRVLNDQIVQDLRIPDYVIDRVAAEEGEELTRRERAYRGGRPPLDVRGRTVILVDDGLATGATMRAAVMALRQHRPAHIVVAVPTASPETCEELKTEVDEVVCAITPEPFHAVGYWYEDFTQTTDQEVRELLARRQHLEEAQPTARDIDSTPREAVREAAHRLIGADRDYDPLMALIGDARFVLLGEASHGTHEFYRERARITQRLIDEKGFAAVAVEADWPDAYRVNRYVRGAGDDFDAVEALADFRRFPRWMWRNTEVVEFIDWLRAHNDALPPNAERTGFYGLDLYSLHASMKAVLQYLEQVGSRRGKAGPGSLCLLRPFRSGPSDLWFYRRQRPRQILQRPSCQPTRRVAPPRRRVRAARWKHRGGGVLLRRAECARGQERRRVLPLDVFWRSVVVEPARRPYGRDPRDAGGASRSARSAG